MYLSECDLPREMEKDGWRTIGWYTIRPLSRITRRCLQPANREAEGYSFEIAGDDGTKLLDLGLGNQIALCDDGR
jgi:hypothetical protein